MSRLDSFIRRLQAQRACLDYLAAEVDGRGGIVLELGLGNGRTYDHLRNLLPDREIFVFERQLAAHPASVPDGRYLIMGDLAETLPAFAADRPESAVLVHADIGSGDDGHNRAMSALLGETLPGTLMAGALVACDQPLTAPKLVAEDLPSAVSAGRYHLYRKRA